MIQPGSKSGAGQTGKIRQPASDVEFGLLMKFPADVRAIRGNAAEMAGVLSRVNKL